MLTEAECLRALPARGFLHDYVVNYAMGSTDAHVGYHIAAGLSALTQIMPVQTLMRYGGSRIRPNLFSLIVATSSDSRKTTSIDLMKEIIELSDPDALMQQPASKEALIALLKNRNRQLLLYPEFGAFLTGAEQGPGLAVKTALNQVFDCSRLSNTLAASARAKANKDDEVKHPRLSILAASAPNYLSRHSEAVDWTDGFFGRFFCIAAERERFAKNPKNLTTERHDIARKYKTLLDQSVSVTGPSECTFDNQSEALWNDWADSIEERKRRARFPAAIIRSMSFAQKIAMLLSADYCDGLTNGTWSITLKALEPALRITELHIKSAQQVNEVIAENPDMRDRFAVLQHIGPKAIPAHVLIRKSSMLEYRFKRVIGTLMMERTVLEVSLGNENGYKLNPERLQSPDPTPRTSSPVETATIEEHTHHHTVDRSSNGAVHDTKAAPKAQSRVKITFQ